MNIETLLLKLPNQIIHPAFGEAYLETKVVNGLKTACYRDAKKGSSYGTIGRNWQEVFESLHAYLKQKGHIEQ